MKICNEYEKQRRKEKRKSENMQPFKTSRFISAEDCKPTPNHICLGSSTTLFSLFPSQSLVCPTTPKREWGEEVEEATQEEGMAWKGHRVVN